MKLADHTIGSGYLHTDTVEDIRDFHKEYQGTSNNFNNNFKLVLKFYAFWLIIVWEVISVDLNGFFFNFINSGQDIL